MMEPFTVHQEVYINHQYIWLPQASVLGLPLFSIYA